MILSRNNPSEIICSHCGQNKAEWVNPEEYYDYDGEPFWWSTRMEVGSYAGSKKYPDQFELDKEV